MANSVVDLTDVTTVTIANGASLSGALNLGGMFPGAFVIPAEFDGAAITFQGSIDDANFFNLYDATGTEVNYTVSASRCVVPNLGQFYGLSSIKVRAGTAGAASNQTGDTVIGIGLVPR